MRSTSSAAVPTKATPVRYATALVGIVAALVTVAVVTSAGADTAKGPTPQFREVYSFDDLASMVAASDLVVVGTIAASAPGRAVGGDAAFGELEFVEVTVKLETVLFGELQDGSVTLEIDASMIPRQDRWDEPGTSVVLFLHEKADRRGYYRPTNSQGVFVVKGERVAAGVVEDKLTDGLTRLGRDLFIQEVRLAADDVRDGMVTPPPPALGN